MDSIIKRETYKELHGKFNKAIKEKFYFEAICIDYALMEDRLKSLLYYLGVFLNREATKLDCQKTSKQLRNIYTYGKTISFKKMNVKIKMIRSIIDWYNSNPNYDDKYLKQLYNSIKKLEIDNLITCLDNIDKWCEKRNILIHAAANKNIFELYDTTYEESYKGMEYVRLIDNQVKKLKKSNTLRKNMNMRTE